MKMTNTVVSVATPLFVECVREVAQTVMKRIVLNATVNVLAVMIGIVPAVSIPVKLVTNTFVRSV